MASTYAPLMPWSHPYKDTNDDDMNGEHTNDEQGLSWSIEGDNSTPRAYDFRTLKNYWPPIEAAFIVDTDPTNDFDPEKAHDLQENEHVREVTQYRPKSYKATRLLRTPKDRVNTLLTGRRRGLLARVCLNLGALSEETRSSEKAKTTLDILSRWDNNWPYVNNFADCANFSELQLDSICDDRLRKRDVKRSMLIGDCQRDEPVDWQDIGLGHPAARGCKACYQLGIECDLIDGGHYPCLSCEEDEDACELIMEPKQKRACESCTKRRVVCSFRNHPDQRGACQSCKDKGLNCVAGPKSGFTREGPSLDNPPLPSQQPLSFGKRQLGAEETMETKDEGSSHPPKKKRRSVRCVPCKQDGAYCSLSKNPKATSCGRCRKNDITCVINDAQLPMGSSATPDLQEIASRTRKPRHWVYDGQIEFAYEGAQLCSWCVCVSHGFFGLAKNSDLLQGEREKGAIDGDYFHATSSRMCYECVQFRLDIMQCSVHTLCALEGVSLETPEDDKIYVYPGLAGLMPWPWCMVCPSKAAFQCCNDCRLRLCKECACYLILHADGKLDRLVEWKEQRWRTELDLRADANFLHSNGYMMKALQNRL